MGISERDIDALMPDPIPDCDRRVSHIDQQGNMAVAEIVDSDLLHAALLAAVFHASCQLML